MTYLILTILSLYIFDPFKRLNGGVMGWLRRSMPRDGSIEIVTIWSGKNSVVYEANDFLKHGENATPLALRENPTDKPPYDKMEYPSTYTKPEESLLSKTKIHYEEWL